MAWRIRLLVSIAVCSLVVAPTACGSSSGGSSTDDAGIDSGGIDASDAPVEEPDGGQRCSDISKVSGGKCVGKVRTVDSRPYCVHVPSSFEPGIAIPLVILLHGYSGTGQLEANYFDFDEVAERRSFILAKPDGKTDASGNSYWNAFKSCCAGTQPNPPDDVKYLSDIVDDIKANYTIDAKRVYVVGHSNGGFMAHRLGCDRASTFAAIVSLAGAVDPNACAPSEPISVLQVHGDKDTIIPYTGGSVFGAPNFPSAEVTISTWAQKDGCSTVRDVNTPIDMVCDTVKPGAETNRESYTGCPAGIDVSLYRMSGEGHFPTFYVPGWGETVWSFLSAHSKR